MNDGSSLSHTKWDCKYHLVWIPKCRRKVLFGQLRKYLGPVFRELAQQRESVVLEGCICLDHVHAHIDPDRSKRQVELFYQIVQFPNPVHKRSNTGS